jgi:hypothetical protein
MLDATGPRRYSTIYKNPRRYLTSTLPQRYKTSFLTLLLNFNTLPIYRKRLKRFAKIPKGAPTYSMVLKQGVLGGFLGLLLSGSFGNPPANSPP